MSIFNAFPTSAGTYTNIPNVSGSSTHYGAMGDYSDSSYIWDSLHVSSVETDTYNIPNHTSQIGPISNLTVTLRGNTTTGTGWFKIRIITHSGIYDGDPSSVTTATNTTKSWDTNPNTGMAWTWDEVDALEIGCAISGGSAGETVYCYDVWATATYSSSTTDYKDIATRFKLISGAFKFIASRFTLSIRMWKDISYRFTLWVRNYKNIGTRFNLTASTYKNISSRFKLILCNWKDIQNRFILVVKDYKDISSRFNLGVVKNIATRFSLISKGYKDPAMRFSLVVQGYKDV
jgi:hypothetical protein